MNRLLTAFAFGAGLLAGLATSAQATEVTLARLDCGTPQAPTVVNERFSDTYAFPGLKVQFVFSCYFAISSSTATNICCGIPVIP